MLGTLLIAIPGYGIALWGALGSIVWTIDCFRLTRQGRDEADVKDAMFRAASSATVAMLFGGATRWLLGGAL